MCPTPAPRFAGTGVEQTRDFFEPWKGQKSNTDMIINKIPPEQEIICYNSFTPELTSQIENFLFKNSYASVFHHPLWVKILAEETRQDFVYFVYRDESEIKAVMPLLFTRGIPFSKSPFSARRISSLPRTPFAGPISNSDEGMKAILHELKKSISNYPGIVVQLKSFHKLDSINPALFSVEWRNTYIKNIPPPGESWTFESKRDEKDIFRAIKRAEQSNVRIRKCSSIEELKKWYNLYLNTMRRNMIPPRSFKFFRLLYDVLVPAGFAEMNFAYVNENGKEFLITGNINFIFADKYFGGYKASDTQRSGYMGGDFLLFTEMQKLQEQGYRFYDLGEVSSGNVSLDKYKRKWGVEKIPIYHNYDGNFSKEIFDYSDEGKENKLIEKIWRLLPLNVTANAGKIINYFL